MKKLFGWVNWRWRLWRARHYALRAWIDLCENRGGHGAWERATHRVEEIRLER